jgi:hypothetical protein
MAAHTNRGGTERGRALVSRDDTRTATSEASEDRSESQAARDRRSLGQSAHRADDHERPGAFENCTPIQPARCLT